MNKRIVLALCLGVFLSSSLFIFSSSDVKANRNITPIVLNLPLTPEFAPVVEDTSIFIDDVPNVIETTSPIENWIAHEVSSGESLAVIFKSAGLNARQLHKLTHSSKKAKSLTKIYPGHMLSFIIDDENNLIKLKHDKNKLETTLYTRTSTGYDINNIIREPDIKYAYRRATIQSSLFLAAQKAQLSHSITMELANIFGWDIDFVFDIRAGDSFELLFEEKFLEGEKLEDGKILAASFINRNKHFKAVLYTDKKGHSSYYTPDGHSMRKEFLRTPVDFARISSHFNLKRRHPVLHSIRAHKGTDYAAGRGTPIKAAGDGKVTYASRKGGYGRVVIIQHGQKYQTLYAHLNGYRKGIRKGKRVNQGQIIGYVGSSGLATGPHLHYEFRVNGAVKNPVTVKLPKSLPIHKNQKARFSAQTQPLIETLAKYNDDTKSHDSQVVKL